MLSHTADTGIEATAGSFPELLGELAAGMFALMAQPENCVPDRVVEADVESTSKKELVVDALAELLYHSEVEDLFLCQFKVRATGSAAVHISAGGVPNDSIELTGPPIKAVTYHDVAADETPEGWYGRVYLDV